MMGEKIIKDFPAVSGDHCSSTAISNITNYYNINYSEPFVFGVGSGLNFIYLNTESDYFSRFIFARNPVFENDFFKTLDMKFRWYASDKSDWNSMRYYIDNDIPLMLMTDIRYLDFYNLDQDTVASHMLILFGYNESDNIAYVSDSIKDGVVETSLDKLINEAMGSEKIPFFRRNMWKPLKSFTIKKKKIELVLESMRRNAYSMLEPNTGYLGISAIKRLENDILYWSDLPEWQRLCNFAYMSLEIIGTGGAGFRKLYVEFLKEVSKDIPFIRELHITEKMEDIAKLYSRLSKQFYLAGSKGDRIYLMKIKDILSQIYILEKEFWRVIKKNTIENILDPDSVDTN